MSLTSSGLRACRGNPSAGLETEVAALRALRDGAVLSQLFNFTEPPSRFVTGRLERIAEAFAP